MKTRDATARLMTPRGEGGISVVRLSGPDAGPILRNLFRNPRGRSLPQAGEMTYGHILDAAGAVIDEAIVASLRPGADEPVFEINCHGGPVATQAVLAALADAGARRSDAPEPLLQSDGAFLERELWAELARALTPLAVRVILAQLHGALAAEVRALAAAPADQERRLAALLETARWGLRLTRPTGVTIVGRPNAGKSTLMNRLLQTERVIVYHQPGTTRDVISELASIDGFCVTLSDTAGIPEALLDPVRREAADAPLSDPDLIAVRRAWAESLSAELLIVLFDGAAPPGLVDRFFASQTRRKALFAMNKADLGAPHADAYEALAPGAVLAVSAETGEGIDELKHRIVRALAPDAAVGRGPVLLTERQRTLVADALAAVCAGDAQRAAEALRQVVDGTDERGGGGRRAPPKSA